MKLDLLTKRFPVIAAIVVVAVVTVLTEAPVPVLMDTTCNALTP